MKAYIIDGQLHIGAEDDTEVYALEQYLKGCGKIQVPSNITTNVQAHEIINHNITVTDDRFIGVDINNKIKGQENES